MRSAGCAPIWARCDSAASFTHEVSQAVRHRLTVSQARYVAGLRDAADDAHVRLGEQDARFGDTFGDLYAGAQTDITAVRSAVEWARSLRVMITGTDAPLTPAQVKEADARSQTSQLAGAADAWQRATRSADRGVRRRTGERIWLPNSTTSTMRVI